jgi:hypothetical protein
MGIQDEAEHRLTVDSLALMRAFRLIAEPEDRRKVIDLAASLAKPVSSPPISPR